MRVLIIEDEPLAQEELIRLININFPHMKIVGALRSVSESISWLQTNRSDLIFMDIHLSDGNSFAIFDHVDVRTPIIFTTAYDKYAIDAFKVNSIGYLLKPILEQDLVNAINKLSYNHEQLVALLQSTKSPSEPKSRIAIKLGDRFSYISMIDVAYFYSEDRTTFVVSKQGRKQIVDYTIESLEPLLDGKHFFRITRGCIASIDSISSVSKYFNSRLKVTLSPPFEGDLLISRVKSGDFLQWLDGQ